MKGKGEGRAPKKAGEGCGLAQASPDSGGVDREQGAEREGEVPDELRRGGIDAMRMLVPHDLRPGRSVGWGDPILHLQAGHAGAQPSPNPGEQVFVDWVPSDEGSLSTVERPSLAHVGQRGAQTGDLSGSRIRGLAGAPRRSAGLQAAPDLQEEAQAIPQAHQECRTPHRVCLGLQKRRASPRGLLLRCLPPDRGSP